MTENSDDKNIQLIQESLQEYGEGYSPDSPTFIEDESEGYTPDSPVVGLNETIINQFNINDKFLILFIEEDEEYKDIVCIIREINTDEHQIFCHDEENDNDLILEYDMENNILLETNDYKIDEIFKIEDFDLSTIEKVDFIITKEIYDPFVIDVTEIKNKKYSMQERKESLITELISSYKAYDNKVLIGLLNDVAEVIVNMVIDKKDSPNDYSNSLYFIKHKIYQNNLCLPSWVIPIVDNKKKLYKLDEEDKTEYNDTYNETFENELKELYNLNTDLNEHSHYKNIISTILLTSQPYNNNVQLMGGKYPQIYHDGHYLRNCSQSSPCNGISSLFTFSNVKTRSSLNIPFNKNHETNFEIIVPKETINVAGFNIIPHTLLDFTFKGDNYNLNDLYFLSDYKYSSKQLGNRFSKQTIIPHVLNNQSEKIDDYQLNIHSYLFNDIVDNDNIGDVLKNNFPNYSDILNTLPLDMILNYNDLEKLLLHYQININHLDVDSITKVNDIIKNNIKEYIKLYNRSVKRKPIQKLKQISNKLTEKEKIIKSKKYIFSLTNIQKRNHYIQKFLDVFSRNPSINENQNFLFEKNSDDKLLCCHYHFLCKSHNNRDIYDYVKTRFGDNPVNGSIFCKVCGEFLFLEEFSTLEGFSDDTIVNTKEELITDTTDIDEVLDEKQIRIKKDITRYSSIFGIELNEYDTQQILDYFSIIDNEHIINLRYNTSNGFQKHPIYQENKKKYTFIKPAKTSKDKQQNKKNKKLLDNDLSVLREYLIDGNHFIITIILILLYVQTSIPPYENITRNIKILHSFNEIETWDNIKFKLNDFLSINMIDIIQIIGTKLNNKHISDFIRESDLYSGLPTFKEQFMNIFPYIIQNPSIYKRIESLFNYENDPNKLIYIKEYWNSYRPQPDNNLTQLINYKTNDDKHPYLLRNGNEISYENFALIQSLSSAFNDPKYKVLGIPFTEIMKNESYKRLYIYSLQLYGKSKTNKYLNCLVNRFLNTIQNSSDIIPLLSSVNWDDSKKQFISIDYSLFKKVFIIDILNYFKSQNPDDLHIIDIFIHLNFNNWSGIMLNGHPKRNYKYTSPIIYPNNTFEELYDQNKEFIEKIFNEYCIDEDGNVHKIVNDTDFILNILVDPQIESRLSCKTNVPMNEENFHKILKNKMFILSIYSENIIDKQTLFNNHLYKFISRNSIIDYDADENYDIFYSLINELTEENYSHIFNEILKKNIMYIERIQKFLNDLINDKILEKKQINRFKSTFGRTTESIKILLNKYIDKHQHFDKSIQSLYTIIGRLSNISDMNGTIFHGDIPKPWKLSDTNTDYLKEYLLNNEFLLHNDIYLPFKKNISYDGFNVYKKEEKYSYYFQGLYDYLTKYYKNKYIDTIIGNDNELLTKKYSQMLQGFLFLVLINKIIDYIDELKNETSSVSTNSNILFQSLEDKYQLNLEGSIQICSQFIFDLLIHCLEEYSDPSWIYQLNDISNLLGKQKEREKQSLINSEKMTKNDSRAVAIEQQKCGISNWHQDVSKKHLEHIHSNEYKDKSFSDRNDSIKELFYENRDELEYLESQGVDTSKLLMITEEEEELGYDQYDQDREDEGLDDNDDDGDYREN